MTSIYDLVAEVQAYGSLSPEQYHKMIHPIPDAKSVNREELMLARVRDKVVLDIGCSGPMGVALRKVAREHHGVDILPGVFPDRYHVIDLDRASELPAVPGLELVIAGEVIEHLSNAGHFLDLLYATGAPVILTTPNAFSAAGQNSNRLGIEQVNREHVSWYSWYTLTNLVRRHGFAVKEWFWYHGKPYIAEGLIFVLEIQQHA